VILLESIGAIKRHLDYMSHEIVEIKKLIVGLESDKQKSNRAWDDLMNASDQISEKWTEVSAADEITSQREKTW
jgi:low affinity Fe/Cu permease